MFSNVLRRLVSHTTIGIVASATARDSDNVAGIGNNSAEIGYNSAEIGDNSAEIAITPQIGDDAAGIVYITAKVIPC